MSLIKNKLISNLPILIALFFTGITTTLGVTKIYQELASDKPVLPQVSSSEDVNIVPQPANAEQNNKLASSNNIVPDANSGTIFTSSLLAQHNKTNDCYIAYNQKVYDVTNQSSWIGCYHHGIRGGRDITSIFPHPTSYLTNIPIVGTLDSGLKTNSISTNIVSNEDENEEYQKNEVEKDEIHEEFELFED